MNEAEAKLVKALRSGEYKQAQWHLKRTLLNDDSSVVVGYGYCCLGVAEEVLRPAVEWISTTALSGETFHRRHVRFGGETEQLVDVTRDMLNWVTTDGTLTFKDRDLREVSLVNCNDELNLTFDQIADLIEHGLVAQAE